MIKKQDSVCSEGGLNRRKKTPEEMAAEAEEENLDEFTSELLQQCLCTGLKFDLVRLKRIGIFMQIYPIIYQVYRRYLINDIKISKQMSFAFI